MAAVASPTFPQHFGQYPHPPPFIPGHRRESYPRPPPVPYPHPATSRFDQAPSSPFIPPAPALAYRSTPDRPDHNTRHHRQRNKRVAFSTPSGGYYSASSSPTIPTLPQWTRQDDSPRRSPWSRFLNRFQQDRTTAPAEASTPVIPTVPQSQPSSTTREQQREQIISLLLPHVPAAEPMIRPLVNHVNDSLQLQQLIDTLNRPLTQQQFLEIQDAFTLPKDEEEEIIKTLNDPRDPDVAILLTQFREFVEAISGRPIPTTSDQVPASKGGAFSRLGRLIPSAIRKSLRSLNRRKRQSAGADVGSSASAPELARSSTEQQDGTRSFPIYKLRESQLRRFIVESFTCTKCETNIPAVSAMSSRDRAKKTLTSESELHKRN
ncbi:hypothetical protein C0993_000487 [Termitomyces sp. T159_Od127]|nr:hypothetical protein C0993_000487 [Termitomyces sp. T159_Od127]